ncbi:hypothetical protein IMZ48_12020, partial [Candidatus Bathyarchaeota archaeon]|nr:hypothetical protein [Candidatus Bathyarchaeota archaeon]
VGGCPAQGESTFEVRGPADTPASDQAILSWSWLNKIGNREFYQNCAAVTIEGGKEGGEDVPFDQRPAMFTANLGDGCSTAPSADVMFPDPGPDADINNADAVPPVGGCGGSGGAPSRGAPADGAPSDGSPADDGSYTPPSGSPDAGSGSPGAGSGAPTNGCGSTPPPYTGDAADGLSEQALSALVLGAAVAVAVGMSLA